MNTQNKCRRCKEIKDQSELYNDSHTLRGKRYQVFICRTCNTERVRKYRTTERGKERTRAANYKSIAKHYHKQAARQRLAYAIRTGKVTKPSHCTVHGCTEQNIQAHHRDYSQPLAVEWLCRRHHSDVHAL